MRPLLLILLLVLVGCNYNAGPARGGARDHEPKSPAGDDRAELKTFVGKVPGGDFAMPMIADEVATGSVQGCFFRTAPRESFIVLYPAGMERPARERAIRLRGRVRMVRSRPPRARDDRPAMEYKQKVITVDSWQYTE